MDQHIAEVCWEENTVVTGEARGHIIDFQNQIEDLTKQLWEMREEVTRAFQRAFAVETQQEEALAQLSTLEEACHQRDEVRAQRDKALVRATVL